MQIFIYDDHEMHVYQVISYHIEQPMVADDEVCYPVMQATLSIGKVIAELDPTTMKRIAKYNLEKEFKGINDKIDKARDTCLELNARIAEYREKISLMDELILKIWEDRNFDDAKYLPRDDDCEEDDEE